MSRRLATTSIKSSQTILPPRDAFSFDSINLEGFEIHTNVENENWTTRKEFFVNCLSYCLGLTNLSRFPKVAWLCGQGSFVLLYIILTITIGSALHFFEVALGQFSNMGSFRVFSLCPLLEGISVSIALYSFLITIYYNIVNVYNFIYLFTSLNKILPYSFCKNGSSNCNAKSFNFTKAPEYQYFHDRVVLITPEKNTLINWRNLGLILFFCIATSICTFKGPKQLKWTTLIYVPVFYLVFLLVLLVSLSLKGSANGLAFMFIPDWEILKNVKTWTFAVEQTLLTLGIGLGPIITLSSYCHFKSPAYLDSIAISVLAILGSLLAGGILFSVMGIIAAEKNVTMNKVMTFNSLTPSGFATQIVYSQLFSRLPNIVGQIMSFLFYTTYVVGGWLSMTLHFENIVFTIYEYISVSRETKVRVNILLSCVCFLSGIFFTNSSGNDLIWKIEIYLVDFGLILIIFLEYVAIIYLYGLHNFCDDVELMLGARPKVYYQYTWIFLPVILVIIYTYVTYKNNFCSSKNLHYMVIGLSVMFLIPVVVIAGVNIVHFKRAGKLRKVLSPRDYTLSDRINAASNILSPTDPLSSFRLGGVNSYD